MDYKKEVDKKFRYIIKNSTCDIKILIKSTDSARNGPYMRINPELLCAVPKLKLRTEAKDEEAVPKDPNDFTPIRKKKHGLHVSKRHVFMRIDRFLNRQEPMSEEELSSNEFES